MRNYFKKQKSDELKPEKDKSLIVSVVILVILITVSLVTGLKNTSLKELQSGFHLQGSDITALIVLTAAYLIFRIGKGRDHGR